MKGSRKRSNDNGNNNSAESSSHDKKQKKAKAVIVIDEDDDVLGFRVMENLTSATKPRAPSKDAKVVGKASSQEIAITIASSSSVPSLSPSVAEEQDLFPMSMMANNNNNSSATDKSDALQSPFARDNNNNYNKSKKDNNNSSSGTAIFRPSFHWDKASGATHTASAKAKRSPPSPQAHKMFSKSQPPAVQAAPRSVTDGVMWVDKYQPSTTEDLCVHKKKVQEVTQWLQSFFSARQEGRQASSRLLVITGPSGSGKTSMMRTICNGSGFNMMEWVNPTRTSPSLPASSRLDFPASALGGTNSNRNTPGFSMQSHEAPLESFRKFLMSARGYSDLTAPSNTSPTITSNSDERRRVLMVEDMPFLHDSNVQREFSSIIKSYIESSSTANPLVLIINTSDTYIGKIVSPTILYSSIVHIIKCNPVSASKLRKSLNNIVTLQQRSPESMSQVVEGIIASCDGDMRSAINALQYYFLSIPYNKQRNTSLSPPLDAAAGKKKQKARGKLSQQLTPASQHEVLRWRDESANGCRDVGLSLFHALGKILYNKREPEASAATDPTHRARQEFDVEGVMDRIDMGPFLFNSYLHENLTNFLTDIDDIADSLSCLSTTDLFSPRDDLSEQLSRSLAVRGMLYHNTHPAPRRFQALFKPHYFQARNSAMENSHSLSVMYHGSPLAISGGMLSSATLATEVVPFIGRVVPSNKYRSGVISPPFIALARTLCTYKGASFAGSNNQKIDTNLPESLISDLDSLPTFAATDKKEYHMLPEDDILDFGD